MNNPHATMRVRAPLAGFRLSSILHCLLLALTLCISHHATAQIPDLTNGGVRFDDDTWNLGPTGMSGWFYRTNYTAKYDGWDTDLARQIEVMTVAAGSPAAGILQGGDVIRGAEGTGADPVAFTADARKSFAYAIGDAEASTPATLKLLVWRAGTTSIMSLTLETMGAYSATAPYNCPKSAAVLEKGLAEKAGITDQKVLDAIERAANFYGAYVDRGSIPYGEHEPMLNYGENGKNGIAALCFKIMGTHNYDANYYSTLAGSTANNVDGGHQGPFPNYLFTPLGANAGGEASMAKFFAEQKWRFELARNWDGSFIYNTYQNGGQGGSGGQTWSQKQFRAYQAMLMPYAAPLRETYMTGKGNTDSTKWLSAEQLDDVQVSSGYDATTRSISELVGDLDNWSPITRKAAAAEIGLRLGAGGRNFSTFSGDRSEGEESYCNHYQHRHN
jgi:hypothetical protein